MEAAGVRTRHGKTDLRQARFRGETAGATASESKPLQFHASDGWETHCGDLWFRRFILLRHGGQAGMEKGPWPDGFRILPGPDGTVGFCELARDSRRESHCALRRANEFIPGSLRFEGRQGEMEDPAHGCADVGEPGDCEGGKGNSNSGEWMA